MTQQRVTKQERQQAAKAAAAKAEAVRRRRQAYAGAASGLLVVAILITVFVLLDGGGDEGVGANPALTTSPGAATSQPAAPEPTQAAPTQAAPNQQLPEGVDPALGTKPQVAPGTGELTKLVVTPIIKGTGPAVRAGQQLIVNYVGILYQTGQEFDASWNRGEPYQMRIGAGEVIPGWDQGLVGVKVGSRVQLDIPADLAYGDNPQGGQPPGPLRFVVDVLAAQ